MQKCETQNLTLLLRPAAIPARITKLGHQPYKYELVNGQKFVTLPKIFERKMSFQHLIIDFGVTSLQAPSSPDYLTLCESDDVKISYKQIREGKAKRFTDVHAFLRELKE